MTDGRSVDVLVIGGGIIGLCVAWAAAEGGSRSVALLEQATIGHGGGSSTGDARMRVLAAYPDDTYVMRGLAAGAGWRAAERAFGRPLLQTTGCLSWGDGQEDLLDGLRRHDLPAEIWNQPDVDRAYPGVRLPAGATPVHQPDGAIIHADRALAAFAGLAGARGAAIHERVAVTALHPSERGATITTAQGAWSAEQVVVCAGPWARDLLMTVGISLPVTMTSQTVCYIPLATSALPPGLIEYGGVDPYALHSPGGGLKAALHAPGVPVDPGARVPPDTEAVRRTVDWARARFGPQISEAPPRVETCIYTSTEDERFLIERHDRIIVVSACSGHGFQYAPDSGRRAAALL